MKRLIPPILFFISILLMLVFNFFLPIKVLFYYPLNLFGIAVFIIGFLIMGAARKIFSKADTEIHTFKQPRKLVSEGPFKFSRNPIYLAFTICLLGIAILLGAASPFIVLILFILTCQFWYIPFEEKAMERTFGNEYLQYKKQVRRWI